MKKKPDFLKKYICAEPLAFLLTGGGFMVFWRAVSEISSSRYWASVWIPVILLPGWFLGIRQLGLRLPRILFIILFFAFLGKDFHLNRNNRAVIDAASVITADAGNYRRAFIAESDSSDILTQIGFFTRLPVLPRRPLRQFAAVGGSAIGLYDVCYLVTDEKISDHEKTEKMLTQAGAELIFARDKDLHHKKQIRVYRRKIPEGSGILPVTGELCPNGGFEKVSPRGAFLFPETYVPCHGVAADCTVRSGAEAISGQHSFYCRSAGQRDIYSAQVPPPGNDCTIVFTVKSVKTAQIAFSIWKFDDKGVLIAREAVLDAVLPDETVQHQFQIPYRAELYADAAQIRCYWSIVAPYGVLIDDFGVSNQISASKCNHRKFVGEK